ncbi:hypothetical protein [Micromonospora sp. NPDC005299]|uniref:HPP family protein n=1 Tax=Micromonospora sp. NPDC005299 TaxID=3364231 RepID=UPI003683CB39
MPADFDESPSRPAARAFAGSAVAVVVAGAVALLTRQPWLFPSLGPAIMLHVEQPGGQESSPRNTVVGHLVALLAGYAFAAVLLVTVVDLLFNRATGRPTPLWAAPKEG